MIGLIMGCLLLTVGQAYTLNSYFSLQISSVLILGFAILWSSIFALFDRYKRQKIGYLILAFVLVMVNLICYQYDISLIEKMNETYDWTMGYDQTESSYIALYARLLMLGVTAMLSTVNYMSQKNRLAKGGLGLVSLGLLAYMSYLQIEIHKIGIMSLMAYALLVIIENQYMSCYGKTQKEEAKRVATYFIPLCLVITLSTVLLPSHKEPMKWQLVKSIGATMQEKLSEMGQSFSFFIGNQKDEFGLNFLSYDESSNLGGNISLQESVMLKVRIKTKTHMPLYLAGSYKDTYTGRSWTVSENESKSNIEAYQLDVYELLYAVARNEDLANDETLIIENRLELTYGKMRTKTFFMPPKMVGFEQWGKQNKLSESRAGILYEKRQGGDTSYSASFLEVNPMSEALQENLRALDGFSYSGENQMTNGEMEVRLSKKIRGASLQELWKTKQLDQVLKERSQEIKVAYTQLPNDFPSRVQDLTQDMTEGYKNNYDKLKAIEAYLRTFTYTTTPGEVPENEDFVDYFLYESKAGYCTYFASAMAMMARSIGIPTRYVEGFIVDYEKAEGYAATYVVRGKKAHAWVEAYFEGFGWVAFEPSAGYEPTLYYPYENENEVMIMSGLGEEDEVSQNVSVPSIAPKLQEEENQIPANKENYIGKGLLFIGRVMFLFIVLVLGVQCFSRWQYHREFEKADTSKRFKMRFYEILYFLEKEGIKLKSQETLSDYARRIGQVRSGEATYVGEMIAAYVKLKYSEEPLSGSEGEVLERAYQAFIADEQEKIGQTKMFERRFMYYLSGRKKM